MQIDFKNVLVGMGASLLLFVSFFLLFNIKGEEHMTTASLLDPESEMVLNKVQIINNTKAEEPPTRDINECISDKEYEEEFMTLQEKNEIIKDKIQTSNTLNLKNYKFNKVDNIGNVYKTELNPTNIIKKYSSDGKYLLDINLKKTGLITDVYINENQTIYVSYFEDNTVIKYSPRWLCGKITIKKETIPNNSTAFVFSKNFDRHNVSATYYTKTAFFSNFSLVDSGAGSLDSITFKILENGKYSVIEKPNNSYRRNVFCNDPSENTIIVANRAEVSISLDNDEEVFCTFTNSHIKSRGGEN